MTIVYTSQFKRDFKKVQKQNKDIAKLKFLIEKLLDSPPLGPKYRDHPLPSNYEGYRECHIGPDWLLIYKKLPINSSSYGPDHTLICSNSRLCTLTLY